MENIDDLPNSDSGGDADTEDTQTVLEREIEKTLADEESCSTISYLVATGRYEVSDRGVFYINSGNDGDEPPRFICSRLNVLANTRDKNSNSWGRLLEWWDSDSVRHTWAAPVDLLQGDGIDVRKELASQGLSISTNRRDRESLINYIQSVQIDKRARCAERIGWHGNLYITPTETVGSEGELVVFQSGCAVEPAFMTAGTAEDWRKSVSMLANGNSRLMFAIGVAFAGVLAEISGEDSGGFHLRGGSSSGKTTSLKVAASVWGHPDKYPRLWRATANGLEGLATLHNDGILILDELSQMNPKEAGESAYMLANGQGKSRAGRYGSARPASHWRLLFLSAGEESLASIMSKAGHQANAGQEIRMADIPADAGAGFGAFEMLNGCQTPQELSTMLKEVACKHHGAVGMDYLRRVVSDRQTIYGRVGGFLDKFVAKVVPKGASGQVSRVARRFGLVAFAGELATSYDLTGWDKGQSIWAVKSCFNAWMEAFGSGNQEHRRIVEHAIKFIETHGASRFEDLNATTETKTINRVGFYRNSLEGGREFLVLSESFKAEFCQGFDRRTVIDALTEAGILIQSKTEPSHSIKIPAFGRTGRVYVLRSFDLSDETGVIVEDVGF